MADKEIKDAYNKLANCGCYDDMKAVVITTNTEMEWWAIRCNRCHKDTGSQKSLNKAVKAWNEGMIN